MNRNVNIVMAIIVAALLVSTAVVFAIGPQSGEKETVWKSVYYDGYTFEGKHDTKIIGEPDVNMTQYDLVIRSHGDSPFVNVWYNGGSFVGIFTDGYLEIKGYDGRFESIMYGAVNPNDPTEMFVIYIDINPFDLTDMRSSIYSCYYTTDGHIPSFDFSTAKDINDWTCRAAFEMGYENGKLYNSYQHLDGTKMTLTDFSPDSGLFKGSFEGTDKEYPYAGVFVPKMFRSIVGCSAMMFDIEYDVWQVFMGKTQNGNDQFTMMCTWGSAGTGGTSGFGKSVYRIYSTDPDVTLPVTTMNISGKWVETSTKGIYSDGKAFTEPTGLEFTLSNITSEKQSNNVLYAGSGCVGSFTGYFAAYTVPGTDWVYIRAILDDLGEIGSDHFNYCTAKAFMKDGKLCLKVYQSFYLDGKYISTISVFENKA